MAAARTPTQHTRDLSVAASFVSVYYQTFVTNPKDLVKMYAPHASARHTEKNAAAGPDAIAAMLAQQYPETNHGRIVVNTLELKDSDENIRFLVKGKYMPFDTAHPAKDFSHIFELKEHSSHPNSFSLVSDVISWSPIPRPQASTTAAHPAAAVAPPPVLKSWSEDTPPLFAKPAPKADISPLQQPMAPPAVTPPPLPVEAPEVSATPTPQPESSKEATPQTQPLAPAVQPPPSPPPAVVAPSPPPEPQPQSQPQKTEPEVKPNMTMLERLRMKQGLIVKDEPKTDEKKAEAATSQRPPAAKKDEAKALPPKAPEAAEGEEKKASKPEPRKDKEKEKENLDLKRKASDTDDKKRTGPRPTSHGGSVVYYDFILKGLPRGTTCEELYALIEPHVAVVRPIKLEARPGKADPGTIRTYAFVLIDKAKSALGVEDVISMLKTKKLQLQGINVIVDRVRDKYLEKKA